MAIVLLGLNKGDIEWKVVQIRLTMSSQNTFVESSESSNTKFFELARTAVGGKV